MCIYSIGPIRLALQGCECQDFVLDGINAHYTVERGWSNIKLDQRADKSAIAEEKVVSVLRHFSNDDEQ